MNYKILFRASLAEEDELKSAKNYFDIIDSRCKIKENDFIIPRYSLLPYAKEFFDDLNYLNAKSINNYHQYNYIADLKNYVFDLGDLTPRTWRASEGIINLPSNCSFILKGETNSKKFQWKEMMFAENKQDIINIHKKLLDDSLLGDQEIYIREFVPLKTFLISYNGLPITNEYRLFIFKNKVISSGYYWSNYYNELVNLGINLNPNQIPEFFIKKVIAKIGDKCNAYVVDVAETSNGNWVVIELNSFEQSGLSKNNSDVLYENLLINIRS